MKRRNPERIWKFVWIGLLSIASATAVFAVLSLVPHDRSTPSLTTLRERSETAFAELMQAVPNISVVTQSEQVVPGEETRFHRGRVLMRGERLFMETVTESEYADTRYIQVNDGVRTYLWCLFYCDLERGFTEGLFQHDKLRYWFDMPALSHTVATVTGREQVEGRSCHVVRILTAEAAGGFFYPFVFDSPMDLHELEGQLERNGLRLVEVELSSNGERLGGDGLRQLLATSSPGSHRVGSGSVVEDRMGLRPISERDRDPVAVLADPTSVVGTTGFVDVFTALWIDEQSLQVVKAEGISQAGTRPGSREHVTLIRSDFRPIHEDHEMPYETRLYAGDELRLVVSVESVDAAKVIPDRMFEYAHVNETLEVEAQRNSHTAIPLEPVP